MLFPVWFNCSLFFVCFVFVRGDGWIFSIVTICDVKTMNSITTWYLYFLLCDETKRKALEIICGCWGQDVFYVYHFGGGLCHKTSIREDAEEDKCEHKSYPPLVSRRKLLPFDSLVFVLNKMLMLVSENISAQKRVFAWYKAACACKSLHVRVSVRVCVS